VGRPNVGKSTLFNRLCGQPLAIVHDAPGVTRDRNYADALILGRDVTFVDTGGFDPTTLDPMGQGIARHAKIAIEEADIVICVLDGSLPPTQPDRDAVQLLRRSDKPVIYVANKMDGATKEWLLSDHYVLGIPELIPVSALHGRHTGRLEALLGELLSQVAPPRPPESGSIDNASTSDPDASAPLRVAFVGRPNAGKSSMFNRLSGEERSLVDNRPGTTVDPVDSLVNYKGEQYVVVDTAGVRRKSRVDDGIEAQSVIRSIRSIDRADVIILMVDVGLGLADQDAKLLALARERGKPIVVGLNKIDLVEPRDIEKKKAEAAHVLHFSKWTKIIPVSALSGHGVAQLMGEVSGVGQRMIQRVPTSQLNRFFERLLEEHPPPTRSGKAPRIYYMTQVGVKPPTFVAFCSSPDHVAESYRRFVVNRLRKEFEYEGVPVRLFFRGKDRE
jgi:GTP-binding protein